MLTHTHAYTKMYACIYRSSNNYLCVCVYFEKFFSFMNVYKYFLCVKSFFFFFEIICRLLFHGKEKENIIADLI